MPRSKGAIASKYRNTGQTCVCANRLLVQDGVYDAFAAKLAEAVKALKVGNGMDDGVTAGPADRHGGGGEGRGAHPATRCRKGARVVAGGERHALGGTFFQPTVLADVTTDMKVAREETFGPVAPLFRFDTEERGDRDGERHRVRPGGILLQPRHRPRLAGRRGAGIRHRRHQRQASSRPKWRLSAA